MHTEAGANDSGSCVRCGRLRHAARVLRVPRSAETRLSVEQHPAELHPDVVRPVVRLLARLQVRQPGAVHVHPARVARCLQLAVDSRRAASRASTPGDGEGRQSVCEQYEVNVGSGCQ